MRYQDFIDHLRRGKYAPVYFFFGEEDYLLEEALQRMRKAVVDPATADFNCDVLYGSEVDGQKITAIASAYPVMAQRRLVVVKEAHRLSVKSLELVARYAARPSPSTCLIVVAGKVDLRQKGFAALKDHSVWVEFKPLYESQVPGWVKTYLSERGLKISDEALLLLQASVGNSLRALVNELEKVGLNLGDRKAIAIEDIEEVVGRSRRHSVFELADAVGSKDLGAALRILRTMLEVGESPVGIVAMLTRHFGLLWKTRAWSRQRKSPDEIAELIQVPRYFVQNYCRQSRNYSDEEIHWAIGQLLATDVSLKTSSLKPRIAMELLLYRVIKNPLSSR